MLFYLRANVAFKVRGISGPFNVNVAWLVNATDANNARQKFEDRVKQDHRHMDFESASFSYTDFAGEIK